LRSLDYTSESRRYRQATGNSEPSGTPQLFEVKYSELRTINEVEHTANMSKSSPIVVKGKIVSVHKHHAVNAWRGLNIKLNTLYHLARRG
jgi:hypothetical protein